jgi:spermidine/putrescine transport system substrate-binding protein
MYYIGYTSSIAGGDDDTVFEYVNWCYGVGDDEEDTIEYPIGYFFSGDDSDEDYIITASSEQVDRQLYAQYPSSEVISRSAVMQYFDTDANKSINQMWINVRCFDIKDVPILVWLVVLVAVMAALYFNLKRVINRKSDFGGNI